ncbi:hypothetical protein N7466_002966 [Penicillium verhagenii]|uniref:uncharacterized protein n=1 Tax=Penicillium verhagenii TaxID=1562060 RepID=UPI002544D42C|nr:uncharacterized protein N7466_002966 [Penicillium verhagenii]KAJ5939832.1 hypothetical protein N7466_002966 [Penicillium verhagenii]
MSRVYRVRQLSQNDTCEFLHKVTPSGEIFARLDFLARCWCPDSIPRNPMKTFSVFAKCFLQQLTLASKLPSSIDAYGKRYDKGSMVGNGLELSRQLSNRLAIVYEQYTASHSEGLSPKRLVTVMISFLSELQNLSEIPADQDLCPLGKPKVNDEVYATQLSKNWKEPGVSLKSSQQGLNEGNLAPKLRQL